jgi:hypothetical protein
MDGDNFTHVEEWSDRILSMNIVKIQSTDWELNGKPLGGGFVR